MLGCEVCAARRADRLALHREIHAVPADDERERRAARPRQGGDRRRHLEGAGRPARSADGDVQPAQAGAGDHRVHRHRRARHAPARRRWSTSPATRTPTRSSTSSARFATRRCRIPPGSIDPARDAQAMEDELILADLGVVERRLERLEKDLKKSKSAELETRARAAPALQGGARKRPAAARARPRRRRPAAAARLSAALGEAAAARHQPRRSRRRRRGERRGTRPRAGLTAFLSRAATAAVPVCAKIELEIAALEPRDARRSSPISACTSRGSIASFAPPTSCSATCRSSPSARTSAARGRFRAAPSRRTRPARSTATSRAASSAPRSSPTTR